VQIHRDQADRADPAFVTHGDHRRQLIVEIPKRT